MIIGVSDDDDRRLHSTTNIVKTSLTKSIGAKFVDVQDEIVTAFEQYIPANPDGDFVPSLINIFQTDFLIEWLKISAYPTIMDIVCRTTNRMLVGLPLCEFPFILCKLNF